MDPNKVGACGKLILAALVQHRTHPVGETILHLWLFHALEIRLVVHVHVSCLSFIYLFIIYYLFIYLFTIFIRLSALGAY